MDNTTLGLTSGYIITFKPSLGYGQSRELTKFISSKMDVDPLTQKTQTLINGATMMEAQDLTMKLMLVSVQKPDGTLLTGDVAFTEIMDMTQADGAAVYAKLDELTTATALGDEDKKKLTLNSSNSSNQVEV